MNDLVRRMEWSREPEPLLTREWLVTNGLGGFASGTVSGVCTRRYHGYLVSALPAPHGRTVMLGHLAEQLRLPDGRRVDIGGLEHRGGGLELHGLAHLESFRLEAGLPVWCYRIGAFLIERRVWMPYGQNTVHVRYRILEGEGTVRLKLRPSLHFRHYESPVSVPLGGPYVFVAVEGRYEIQGDPALPPLRMRFFGERSSFTVEERILPEILYRIEEMRGYEATGTLWSPGLFRTDLAKGRDATLIASTESWETLLALSPAAAWEAEQARRTRLVAAAAPAARSGPAAELVLAADQFLITPAGRIEDAARARAEGDDIRTVIAGYHWFTDWGRDTMISLEGLALTTGRAAEAGCILRTFGHYVRDGLIPNMFPDGEKDGLYHTADATLWFFHAVDRYLEATGDHTTLQLLLPTLRSIVEQHVHGTRFGIGVDPADGLLRQGEEGYQLTWMDAKVDGWVVTPRRGKAVEINALWYNALRLLEGWLLEAGDAAAADVVAGHAARARRSFNDRFWYAEGGWLYDVIDGFDGPDGEGGERGDDPACRPNQLLSISLRHPVLDRSRWERVIEVVREKLLTPVGLRSLAPGHPDYKPRYFGDLRTRDAAYHQGTVWGWLIGPFVDAWLKLHPGDRAGARRFLDGFVAHLGEADVGSISEIFDAEAPFTPRGCVAQAWSVAEVLRCWVATAS